MKKRWIYNTAAGVLLAVMLTGCGDGTDMEALSNSADNLDTMAVSVQSEAPEGTEPEVTEPPASDEIRLQYRTGFLTAEEEGAVLEESHEDAVPESGTSRVCGRGNSCGEQ